MRRWIPILILVVAAACMRQGGTGHHDWQQMPQQKKVLFVKTLMGHEKAKQAKGGNDRVYPAPAEQYAAQIDAAYQRGSKKSVEQLFEGMGVPAPPKDTKH